MGQGGEGGGMGRIIFEVDLKIPKVCIAMQIYEAKSTPMLWSGAGKVDRGMGGDVR